MEPGDNSRDREALQSELDQACQLDPHLYGILDRVGYPEPRRRPPDFSTLVQIINAQQLSTRAAAAIWHRLEQACRGTVTPEKIRNRSVERLRACGLSERKVNYIRGLAEAMLSRQLVIEELSHLPDGEVISEITRIRGLGKWSAEIFAMFALDRKNIFPDGDLALRVAVQRYRKMRSRPGKDQVREIAETWSPHKTAVALLMWKYYGTTTLEVSGEASGGGTGDADAPPG